MILSRIFRAVAASSMLESVGFRPIDGAVLTELFVPNEVSPD